ncbi:MULTISPECIES: hypothetical protein [Bradyrhizobium]|uniref:Uncharacterized protein n=1 Tax=Bradyrhizobium barranii subsp. barranii TaxID=2823807 RepID=A0A939S590_9BRAD|nr:MULTISPECIES: hypothetical protein [Bradyrhizobium]MBR0941797.1 hypothetical protein [Bradyrhizobium liaoningense]MDI2076039.1 hypothetical protein [Bradyrhizobium sp. Mp27]UEM17053.1 hypothetical protein J4G43_024190 [Bradyrhizobium barranii subsp. barranii]
MAHLDFPASPIVGQTYSVVGSPIYTWDGEKWTASGGAAPLVREMLTAARTYFVNASTGSNSNDGLTSATAFLTLQKAYDTVVQKLDTAGQAITIQGAGAFTAGISMASPWVGGGSILIDLGGGSINAASGNALACSCALPAIVTIQNGTVGTGAGGLAAISNGGVGNIIIGAGITFASVGGGNHIHMYAFGQGAKITAGTNYSISGNAAQHLLGSEGGAVIARNITVTILANLAITTYAYAERQGFISAPTCTFALGAFTVTGTRYLATALALIYTFGGGANYFPGTIAGSAPTSGAQYI